MTHTIRSWYNKHENPWKLSTMSAMGHHRERKIRKYERHSIRCHHRTNFAHGIYETLPNKKNLSGEYFD